MIAPFTQIRSVVIPFLQANIDTDQICPGKDLMRVSQSGFAHALFSRWRFRLDGSPDPEFVLNHAPYQGASILLTGPNFGCGSSREAAAWALRDFGIRCLIGTSFGSIFAANCYRCGVLPIRLGGADFALIEATVERELTTLTVDLERCCIVGVAVHGLAFSVPAFQRDMLLHGRDLIDATLTREKKIEEFQRRDRVRRPWIYVSASRY